ncbi:hypothetical protein BCR43DRAFT_510764 [Syncephalastrum racemosum]|uniref:Uncharacterized protein n=1 Tax=Syncephalastrum racemosum TaxID=13706 RepID=A0A1X2HXE2_SYNRA|nr:hypothetical protein BCR43DRAFT_510764 [Syncephalastrum racemosum]
MPTFDNSHCPRHKRIPSPTDYDRLSSEHARKKYISEQFARDIAALSLNSEPAQPQHEVWQPGQEEEAAMTDTTPVTQSIPQYFELNHGPTKDRDLHVQVEKTALVGTHMNGVVLPMAEMGDGKLVIPDFILREPTHPSSCDTLLYRDFSWRYATAEEERKINDKRHDEESDDDGTVEDPNAMDID